MTVEMIDDAVGEIRGRSCMWQAWRLTYADSHDLQTCRNVGRLDRSADNPDPGLVMLNA